MRDHPISREELQQAVDYLIGHQALDFETSSGVADQFGWMLPAPVGFIMFSEVSVCPNAVAAAKHAVKSSLFMAGNSYLL
jgi:hypothetical protein